MIEPFPSQPMTRQRRSAGQMLEAARKEEEKALARAARKRLKVEKYEATQRNRNRKLDTRRKIIVGALAWEHRDHDALFKKALTALLNDYVLKDEERALVGLAPLPPDELKRALAAREAKGVERRKPKRATAK